MTTADRGARLRAVQAAGAAAALFSLPAAANAAEADDPPSPLRAALRAPVGGHLTVAGQMRAARRDADQRRLTRVATRLQRRVAHVRRVKPDTPRLRGDSPAALRERITRLRGELTDARRERAIERVAIPPQLEAIAACESGGDPGAIGGGGLYRGKYQFDLATWASVGGSGDPAAAPESEQDMRAALLYDRAGATPWPVCGG
jgi:Transglycosylase-like domain